MLNSNLIVKRKMNSTAVSVQMQVQNIISKIDSMFNTPVSTMSSNSLAGGSVTSQRTEEIVSNKTLFLDSIVESSKGPLSIKKVLVEDLVDSGQVVSATIQNINQDAVIKSHCFVTEVYPEFVATQQVTDSLLNVRKMIGNRMLELWRSNLNEQELKFLSKYNSEVAVDCVDQSAVMNYFDQFFTFMKVEFFNSLGSFFTVAIQTPAAVKMFAVYSIYIGLYNFFRFFGTLNLLIIGPKDLVNCFQNSYFTARSRMENNISKIFQKLSHKSTTTIMSELFARCASHIGQNLSPYNRKLFKFFLKHLFTITAVGTGAVTVIWGVAKTTRVVFSSLPSWMRK